MWQFFQDVQVGAVAFTRGPRDLWNLNTHSTKKDVLEAIKNIPYRKGGTRTGAALNFVHDKKLTAISGRRPGIPAVTLVVTDGKSYDDVTSPAYNLQKKSTVIAIGVKVRFAQRFST